MFWKCKYFIFSYLLYILLLLFIHDDCLAQLIVKDSLVINRKGHVTPTYEVIVNKKNLILIESLHSSSKVRGDYNISIYDSLLHVKHTIYWDVNRKYEWWAYDIYDSDILLMCKHKSKSNFFNLSVVNPTESSIIDYEIQSPLYLDVIDIFSLKNSIFLWGTGIKNTGIVLACIYKKNKIILLEKITYDDIEIINMWADKENNLFYTLTKNKKKGTFHIHIYSNNGDLIDAYTIRSKKTLLQANLVSNGKDIYLAGLYSELKKKEPQGIFLYKWTGKEGTIKYLPYLGLKNFFLYLSEKYEKRFRKRQAKRELLGKKMRFSMSASIVDIKKENNFFHLLAECYYEKKLRSKNNNNINSRYYNNLAPGKTYHSNNFKTVRVYSHGFSITFNDDLDILYDASISLKGEDSEGLENYLSFDDDQKKQIFFRIKDNNIFYNVFKKDVSTKQSPFKQSEQSYKINKFKISDLIGWYDDYFIITGKPKKTIFNASNDKIKIKIYKVLSE